MTVEAVEAVVPNRDRRSPRAWRRLFRADAFPYWHAALYVALIVMWEFQPLFVLNPFVAVALLAFHAYAPWYYFEALVSKRWKRLGHAMIAATLCVAVAVPAMAAGVSIRSHALTARKEQGDYIAAVLERYRERRGTYPEKLEDLARFESSDRLATALESTSWYYDPEARPPGLAFWDSHSDTMYERIGSGAWAAHSR